MYHYDITINALALVNFHWKYTVSTDLHFLYTTIGYSSSVDVAPCNYETWHFEPSSGRQRASVSDQGWCLTLDHISWTLSLTLSIIRSGEAILLQRNLDVIGTVSFFRPLDCTLWIACYHTLLFAFAWISLKFTRNLSGDVF